MEPIHPSERLDASLLTIVIVLVVLLSVQYALGHWDTLLAAAVEFFPYWPWGG